MKELYLDVTAGVAGDMLMGALYGLIPEKTAFLDAMGALELPGLQVQPQPVEDHGLRGVHMAVTLHGEEELEHDHDHHGHHGHHGHAHRSLEEIFQRIDSLHLPESVRARTRHIYGLLAEAESHAHGEPVTEIHFHEVGMDDAIADIAGVCLLVDMLSPDRIVATPIAVGSGHVHCAHGVLPVPAPATAWLLRDLPTVPGSGDGELCTPTGAALLRALAAEFAPLPDGVFRAAGHGFGSRKFAGHANAVSAYFREV